MAQKGFPKYDPHKQYGIILLLAGENTAVNEESNVIQSNPNYYPRSKKAAQILQTGNVKNGILVTGGYGGLDKTRLDISGGERSFNYLILLEKIPYESLFFDDRSRETLGNFALPAETPMIIEEDAGVKTFPHFNDLESILLITEEGHMSRSLNCAEKVLPHWQMDYLAVEGPYKPGMATKAYHASLMQATRHITKPNPAAVVEFLENEHSFYEYGDEQWFKKPLNNRRIILARTCIGWLVS